MKKTYDPKEVEFKNLVNEIRLLGFTHSNQVSNYIVKNKLGYKYRHISGILKMKQGDDVWNFKGGFPPKIYASLCKELGVSNQGTKSKPLAFKSFKEIADRQITKK
ncbi:MAG: hypothetical protein GX043_01980 [Desulfovibrionales bacterium]|nr:hypothetical protein [Desulfovibrionales bacterium]